MTPKLSISLVLSVAAAFCHNGWADNAAELDTVIVSGGLTPITAKAYGRSVTVLTGKDIRLRDIHSIQDALRALPGVAVNGSGGNYTQVRIRGGEANHTLILIDGVEAAGGDGTYILSGLETSNIERIEVLRGPQSAYYGSNASTGVINIITRQGELGTEYNATLKFGSHGNRTLGAFASLRNERGGLSFSASDAHDAGWDFSGDGGERDGTERTTLIIKGDYQLMTEMTLGFNLRRAEEDYDYDSNNNSATNPRGYVVDDDTRYSHRDESTSSLYGEQAFLGGRATHRIAYELTDNEHAYNGKMPTKTKTEAFKYRLSYALDGTVRSSAQLINLLLEREKDSSSTKPLYQRKTNSVALEYRHRFANGLDLQAGARFDSNSVFQNAKTWNLSASYLLDSNIRLHSSAGTGVVNPSYFELYADAYGYSGNPALQPERNRSFDIGIELPLLNGRALVDTTYFNEALLDEITAVKTGPGTFSYLNQTGKSRRQGIEIEGQLAATDTLDLRLSYTYLDAKNPDGSVEVRRPRHELGLGMTLQAFDGRASLSADLRHVAKNADKRYFKPYGVGRLPDYTVVDVAGRYTLNRHVDLTLTVKNLFDKAYADVWGYASRDRTIYAGIDATW